MVASAPNTTAIPIGGYDGSGNEKISLVAIGWVLDAHLDPKKVEAGWKKLCETWPILAARLRANSKTKQWEFHLSSTPTPAYAFAHRVVAGKISAHYRYSTPSDTIRCTVKANPDDLFSDPARRSVDYLMKHDVPQTALQLTSFDDGTILGLSIPHALADGHGYKEIMRALVQVIRGEQPASIDTPDPFVTYQGAENPPAKSGWRFFSMTEMILFLLALLWNFIRYPVHENRQLYFPPDEIRRIKQQALDDLNTEGKSRGEWVSTSDALIAFVLKCIHPKTTSQTPLKIVYATNMRKNMPHLFPAVYIRNAARGVVLPSFPVSAVHTLSLGELALVVRRTLQQELTPEATEAYLRWRLAEENAGKTAMFMEPLGRWHVISNWRDMNLMDIDFSAAAATPGEKVKCVYLWMNGYQAVPARHCWALTADDPRGGIWMSGCFTKQIWERKDGFGQFIHD